jgi:hypothetical protein
MKREKKNKGLDYIYMAMGPSGAQCQEWPCRLIVGSKLLLCCAALLCSAGSSPRVEAWSNTSTVTLRVVGGDEKGSLISERVPRDSGPRKVALARASSIYKIQTRPLVREDAPQIQDRKGQTVINIWP